MSPSATSAVGSIANIVIAYNSVILSRLLDKYKAAGNDKVVALLQKISSVAWQHTHFLWRYDFMNNYNPIDFEEILANLIFD